MDSERFETFADAIIAIIITIIVLQFTQPNDATFSALWSLKDEYIAYLMSFLIIFTIWRSNHNLFQQVKKIDNLTVVLNGILLFIISTIPYFTKWLADNLYSLATETMIGIIFISTHIIYSLSVKTLLRHDPYNKDLQEALNNSIYNYIPLIIILIGFVLTYTIFPPGISLCNFIAIFTWITLERKDAVFMETSRFKGFVDAILAIILTIIILEIILPTGGNWRSLEVHYLDFITYAISFVVIFNYWNYHNNFFGIVNSINNKVIWSEAASLFVISFLPFFTNFVSHNFYTFFAQFLYGLDFILFTLINIYTARALIESDPANIALKLVVGDHKRQIFLLVIIFIGIIIGYLFYPPAIIISCISSIIAIWIFYLK